MSQTTTPLDGTPPPCAAGTLAALSAELTTIARLQDTDELRRRAVWAAAVAKRMGLLALSAELAALSRLQDTDEMRRRAGWAAAETDQLLAADGSPP